MDQIKPHAEVEGNKTNWPIYLIKTVKCYCSKFQNNEINNNDFDNDSNNNKNNNNKYNNNKMQRQIQNPHKNQYQVPCDFIQRPKSIN